MDYKEVINFWFGNKKSNNEVAQEMNPRWWKKDPAFDKEILTRFEPLIVKAIAGELDDWKKTPQGFLALIILLDPFARNSYRNTSKAFEFDSYAQQLTKEGVEKGFDKKLRLIERVFFYLPYQHSEDLRMQEQSLILYESLIAEAPKDEGDIFEEYYDFAVRHADIILKFQRFPHRNKVLGRRSTAEEEEFLQQPSLSF